MGTLTVILANFVGLLYPFPARDIEENECYHIINRLQQILDLTIPIGSYQITTNFTLLLLT